MPQSPGSVPCTLLRVPNGTGLRFVNLYIEWENCPEKLFFMEELLSKLAAFVDECENQIKIKHIKKLHKKLYALKESEGIVFVHGTGKKI